VERPVVPEPKYACRTCKEPGHRSRNCPKAGPEFYRAESGELVKVVRPFDPAGNPQPVLPVPIDGERILVEVPRPADYIVFSPEQVRLTSGDTIDDALLKLAREGPMPIVYVPLASANEEPVMRVAFVSKHRESPVEVVQAPARFNGQRNTLPPRCITCKRRWTPKPGVDAATTPCNACAGPDQNGQLRVNGHKLSKDESTEYTSRERVCETCKKPGERTLGTSIQGARPACARCGTPTAEGHIVQQDAKRAAR
jgi:hypothetical protein